MSYILGEDTYLDLESIWDYIAEGSIDAADKWIGELFDAFEAIGDNPGIGHKREDLTAYPILFWPFRGLPDSLSCNLQFRGDYCCHSRGT